MIEFAEVSAARFEFVARAVVSERCNALGGIGVAVGSSAHDERGVSGGGSCRQVKVSVVFERLDVADFKFVDGKGISLKARGDNQVVGDVVEFARLGDAIIGVAVHGEGIAAVKGAYNNFAVLNAESHAVAACGKQRVVADIDGNSGRVYQAFAYGYVGCISDCRRRGSSDLEVAVGIKDSVARRDRRGCCQVGSDAAHQGDGV